MFHAKRKRTSDTLRCGFIVMLSCCFFFFACFRPFADPGFPSELSTSPLPFLWVLAYLLDFPIPLVSSISGFVSRVWSLPFQTSLCQETLRCDRCFCHPATVEIMCDRVVSSPSSCRSPQVGPSHNNLQSARKLAY
jgi:hypothetical protein